MNLSKWHLVFLLALAIAVTTQAQTILAPELPNPKQKIHEDIKGALEVKPEAKDLLKETPAPTPAPVAKEISAVQPETLSFQKFGAHLGLGLPHPIFVGLDYLSANRMWSATLDTGAFGGKVDTVTLSLTNYEGAVRFHPWSGSFFVGLAAGQQNLKAKSSDSNIVAGQTVTAEVNINTSYYTPQLGWHWTWDSGFQMGFELGAQLSGSAKTDFTSNAAAFGITEANNADYAKIAKEAREKGDLVGKATLPYLTLLKLGWVF